MEAPPDCGAGAQALKAWVEHSEIGNHMDAERKLKALEQENKDLRRANACLRNALACFAQAQPAQMPLDTPKAAAG